jgi:hypothetical protein
MLNLFNSNKQLLDEDIIEWIFSTYAWAFEQFDKEVFFNETVLVVPDNKHFPGRETTAEGMANLIFEQVKSYAGMAHWPTKLFNLGDANCQVPEKQPIKINGALRGKNAVSNSTQNDLTQSMQSQNSQSQNYMPQSSLPQNSLSQSTLPDTTIPQSELQGSSIAFTYYPQQLKSPEGIIAHFTHGLSHQLASTANTLPPGGGDYIPMAGELTGIFMGFGLMFTNSAVVQRSGGCGGCGGGQSPMREVFMNEEESAYALAVFCHLKGIEGRTVNKHLKKHLRGFFKLALKDCKRRLQSNSQLKLLLSNIE